MDNIQLLEQLADRGQMSANEFLKGVPRTHGEYVDFYSAAALLHAGYVSTDSTTESGGEKKRGTLGIDTRDTAIFLQQLMLPKGDKFQIDGCPRESAIDFPVTFFITADGYLKLEELNEKKANQRQQRLNYLMSFLVAVVAAVLSAILFNYFAVQREAVLSGKEKSLNITVESAPNNLRQPSKGMQAE